MLLSGGGVCLGGEGSYDPQTVRIYCCQHTLVLLVFLYVQHCVMLHGDAWPSIKYLVPGTSGVLLSECDALVIIIACHHAMSV